MAGLEHAVGCALDFARCHGASEVEVGASAAQGLDVTVRLDEIETVEHRHDRSLSVTVYVGQRKGAASTSDLAPEAIRATVEKACAFARFTGEDPYAGLLEADAVAHDVPDLDLDHPWALEPGEAIEVARRCERAGFAAESRVTQSLGASVSRGEVSAVIGNSHGFLAGYAHTTHSIGCALVAGHESRMERGSWLTVARDAADLQAPETVGATAAGRAAQRLGARKLRTCRAPVLFAPEVARGLLGHFVAAVQGTSQYREASFLLGAVGQQIFPSFVRMSERPHLPKGLASAPFDAEGAATHNRELIDAGILTGYVLDAYSARRLGFKTTGNAGGLHNLLVGTVDGVSNPHRTHEDLLRAMGSGFLVTELMGQGVNRVTGDYSRGATGFWIDGGAIAHAVHEVTIAGNLKRMYRDIVAIGDDVDARRGIRCGSVWVEEMTIAGD